jgi:hypothetical protein
MPLENLERLIEMKKLPLFLVFASAAVSAGDYWHPAADEVVVAGADPISVCYYPAPCTGPAPECADWSCDTVFSLGARDPVYYTLMIPGPVRVQGARWAYAWDGANWVPMAKD